MQVGQQEMFNAMKESDLTQYTRNGEPVDINGLAADVSGRVNERSIDATKKGR